MHRSYATEIALDIRPLGIPLSTTGQLERWLVKQGDRVQAGSALARLSLGSRSYELRLQYSGKVDLIQTAPGERIYPGIALVQILSESKPLSDGARLVLLDANQLG